MCDKYLLDIANSLRGRLINKHQPDETHTRAAVVMIIKKSSHDYNALFIKRSESNEDAFSGHMAFPGGIKRVDDKSLLYTAMRETYEEVGIKLRDRSVILGELDDCRPNNPRAQNMVVTPFVSYLSYKPSIKIDNLEVADYVWIPVRHLYQQYGQNLRKYGEIYDKKRFEYKYGKYFIWGLTGRIITQFIELTSHVYKIEDSS